MRHNYGPANRRRLFFPLIALLIFLLLGGVVMLLWNSILPDLVDVQRITYLQAAGLLLLCRILFGGFGRDFFSGGKRSSYKKAHYWREKWRQMTPEEKARMKEEWKRRWRGGERETGREGD